jgi:glycine cleavage system H lipoate-binding protein
MKGRIEFRACNHDYRCGNCEFDQFFNDEYSVHAVIRPVEMSKVKGLRIPQGYYFHEGHTWLRMEEGSTVRVGIDEFALRLLGPLERIEAPLMGKAVAQGRGEIRADRGGRTAMIASPVSGVVTAVNPKLREQGQVAHDDPYSDGWVMSVHAGTLRQDLKHLMIHSETEAFMAAEVERLFQTIEEAGGPLSIDGGQLGTDIYGSMPQLGWDKLVRRFLRT